MATKHYEPRLLGSYIHTDSGGKKTGSGDSGLFGYNHNDREW